MKALLISRPGDFGVLEDLWTEDPLFLPLPGGTVLELHEAAFRLLGITEARVLRCHPAGAAPDLGPLEEALAGRDLAWSVRPWPVGPWPQGLSLPQVLARQHLFLGPGPGVGGPALLVSVPGADPRGWTGPRVPHGFPPIENAAHRPLWVDDQGTIGPWDGPAISLAGTNDFFKASMRFLETLPPPPVRLVGIHRQATLQAPLALGRAVRAASRSRLGPQVQLAAGSRLDHGTALSRTLVLTPTHFAADLALADKIVVAGSVIEPVRGEVIPLQ